MLKPHATAGQAGELTRMIQSMVLGSESYVAALRRFAELSRMLFDLRAIEWNVLRNPAKYEYIAHNYIATKDAGVVESANFPREKKETPEPAPDTPKQRTVRKMAAKTIGQHESRLSWVYAMLDKVTNDPEANERQRFRAFSARMWVTDVYKEFKQELESFIAGAKDKQKRQSAVFAERYGSVHAFRDYLYANSAEAQTALEADTKMIPHDHDLIGEMCSIAFLRNGNIDENAFSDLEKYINSAKHALARKESEEIGGDPEQLDAKAQRVKKIVHAQWALAGCEHPETLSARGLIKLLGVSNRQFYTHIKPKLPKKCTRKAIFNLLQEWYLRERPQAKRHKPIPKQPTAAPEPTIKEQFDALTPDEQADVLRSQKQKNEELRRQHAETTRRQHIPGS